MQCEKQEPPEEVVGPIIQRALEDRLDYGGPSGASAHPTDKRGQEIPDVPDVRPPTLPPLPRLALTVLPRFTPG